MKTLQMNQKADYGNWVPAFRGKTFSAILNRRKK